MPGPVSSLMRRVANDTRTLPQNVARACSKIAEQELAKTVKGSTGGDARLSGMGNAKVSTKTETAGSTVAVATIRPARRTTGMWVILEDGTDGHDIRPRRGRTVSQPNSGRARGLNVGGEWAAGPWTVRGAPGKRTWTKAIAKARPMMDRAGRDELAKVVRG